MVGLATIARTDRSSSYARHIGRVGGLAFALGVGAAVLTGGGVAFADTSDSATGSSESTSASSSPASAQDSGTDAGPVASGSESTQESEADAESQADAETETDATVTETDAALADEAQPEAVAEVESLSAATEDAAESVVGQPVAQTDDAEVKRSSQSMTAAPAASAAASLLVAVDESPASAQAAPNPFETFFANKTPTLDHNPAENNAVEGRIEGDLHPADADSSRLTYTATAPAHGTVVINSDGTFVYTAGSNYTGQDRFDVTVSDASSGLHIHGFAGLLNLITFGLIGSSGHRTTETVFIGAERTVVASGLNSPVDFRFLPDGRIVVAEKGGAIRIIENGTVAEDPLITLSVSALGERGISGLEVDPNFADNGYLYVAYTTSAIRNRLSRLTVVGNAAGSELVLLQSTESAALNHQGGALAFGPDGKLYWGLGDNGSGPNSQNLTNLHGKILRINPDGSTPSDNPVLAAGALPQIYAYGLRNPFRLTFAPTGQLLVADVGAAAFEEVNLVTAGGNYGWPGAEGICNSCSAINPIYTYPRDGGAAITSVLVYDGATFGPGYLNKVFIADLVKGWIKVLTCTPDFTSCGNVQTFDPQAGSTLVLSQGSDGNIYQLTYQPGSLVRIAPAGNPSSAAELV